MVQTLLAILLTMGSISAAFAGTISGALTVNNKTISLKQVYAFQVPDWSDKTKSAVRVLITDKPVPTSILNADVNSFELRDADIGGIRFEFYSDATNYSMELVGNAISGSISASGTFDKEKLTDYSMQHIAGAISEEKVLGDTSYRYQVTFDSDVLPRTVKAEPTPADTAAAQNAESAKAYLAFREAVKAGDLATLRAAVTPERAKAMDQPEFKEQLTLIQALMPDKVTVLKATEEGDSATVILSADEGQTGTVSLTKLNGRWLVAKESWKSN